MLEPIPLDKSLKVTAPGTDGNTYWLAEQSQYERDSGLCQGCAFNSRTCEKDIGSDLCADYSYAVWKAVEQ